MSQEPSSIQGRNWRIPQWFPDFSEDELTKIKLFYEELVRFNGRINLISPKSEKNGDLIHVSDAILASRSIKSMGYSGEFYDIGSGNGLPGVIFAILNPSDSVKLVDADSRKSEFLKHCIHSFGISNASVVVARCEDLDSASIKLGFSRGLASVSKTLLLLRKAAAPDCTFFHCKGETWPREVAEIPVQILQQWNVGSVKDYLLPNKTTKLSVIVTTKK